MSMTLSLENTFSNVGAGFLRSDFRIETHRHSEIGSHTSPKTRIFIRGGELEKVMAYFHEKLNLQSSVGGHA